MTQAELLAAWQAHEQAVGRGRSVALASGKPDLLAGLYLDWAGNLARAISTVETHCSGQWIDRPRFSGCDATLAILRGLTP
jgi:hypothetical protein